MCVCISGPREASAKDLQDRVQWTGLTKIMQLEELHLQYIKERIAAHNGKDKPTQSIVDNLRLAQAAGKENLRLARVLKEATPKPAQGKKDQPSILTDLLEMLDMQHTCEISMLEATVEDAITDAKKKVNPDKKIQSNARARHDAYWKPLNEAITLAKLTRNLETSSSSSSHCSLSFSLCLSLLPLSLSLLSSLPPSSQLF